jgi:carbonic anhydrase
MTDLITLHGRSRSTALRNSLVARAPPGLLFACELRALAAILSQRNATKRAAEMSVENLIANNRRWSEDTVRADPHFFRRLAAQQAPKYLWIGCSDSRVPANQIMGLLPGEVFVHRNVANLVVHTDLNCLSVLQYAVEVLRVEHVIVCGHYGCGGVAAACRGAPLGLIDNWLRHIQDVADRRQGVLLREADPSLRADRLCELNVLEQAHNVCRTTIVQDAWKREQPLTVNSLIYRLSDGLLQDLGFTVTAISQAASCFAKAIESVAGRAQTHLTPAEPSAPPSS